MSKFAYQGVIVRLREVVSQAPVQNVRSHLQGRSELAHGFDGFLVQAVLVVGKRFEQQRKSTVLAQQLAKLVSGLYEVGYGHRDDEPVRLLTAQKDRRELAFAAARLRHRAQDPRVLLRVVQALSFEYEFLLDQWQQVGVIPVSEL